MIYPGIFFQYHKDKHRLIANSLDLLNFSGEIRFSKKEFSILSDSGDSKYFKFIFEHISGSEKCTRYFFKSECGLTCAIKIM